MINPSYCGILPINKASSCRSFQLISLLRKRTQIAKIGHAGTLDPFASGVMILLIGRDYTKLSDEFLLADKQYHATMKLGHTTDTFDVDGQILSQSDYIPSLLELKDALLYFQTDYLQIPPMYSAKKIQGKKLYELARKGISVERKAVSVQLSIELLTYEYPYVELDVSCSKGTYIRALAEDLGQKLKCGAFLSALCRTRSGNFLLSDCVDQSKITDPNFDFRTYLHNSNDSKHFDPTLEV